MKRFTVICAGRRFGKSQLCAYIALRELLKPGTHTWIASPTHDLSKKVFDHLLKFIARAFPEDLQRKRITKTTVPGRFAIRIPRLDSWVECKSAEAPEGLLGEELDLVIIDECSRIKKTVWEGYISPCLTTREGSAIFISTPFGKNWFHKLWYSAKSGDLFNRGLGAAFNYKSVVSPYFPKSEWEREKASLPEQVFNQEYRAQFQDNASVVFRNIEDCTEGQFQDFIHGHQYVMGVDLGKFRDFTVLIVVDMCTHGVVYFERFGKIDWSMQKNRIIQAMVRYNKPYTLIDSTSITVGDAFVEDLRMAGYPVEGYKIDSNMRKRQLVEKLSLFLDQKNIKYPKIPELIDELEAFSYEMTEGGVIRYNAPEGLHDDCVISLALAIQKLMDQPIAAKRGFTQSKKRIQGIGT